ncbi:MAG: cell division protein FtsQ [Prevotella sp.]|nr:cell division protein FtsQ [Prevotella sp.]
MYIQWKRIIITALDIVLAGYLVMAVTSWNNPDGSNQLCTKVNINISDANNAGFLTAEEIKHILEKDHLYPLNKKMQNINPRSIEEALNVGPFVKTAQCFKTKNGHVNISITQRMPIIRIKSQHGDDYYLDDNGGILPNSKYTSDLIIASGNISRHFAKFYIAPLAKTISTSHFWLNQIEQINVLPDHGIELVPRVGDHIIFIGYLPANRYKSVRDREIYAFATRKLSRLEKFYRYGLSQAGWNKYSYIDVQFDNQIICKKRNAEAERAEAKKLKKEASLSQQEQRVRTEEEEREKARKEVERQEHTSVEEGPTE